jgi:hypothetical protein
MRRIPHTKYVVTTEAELDDYGMTIGNRVNELAGQIQMHNIRMISNAYDEQIRQLQALNMAMATFIGRLDDDFEGKADLIARIEEFAT